MHMMKVRDVLVGFVVSAVVAWTIVSCGGGGGGGGGSAPLSLAAQADADLRSATLTGADETPPITTTATGKGGVVVNRTTKAITGGITFTGLSPTQAHIHQGAL